MFGFGFGLSRACLRRGGASVPPSTGDLQIDGFAVLIDTFPIVFA